MRRFRTIAVLPAMIAIAGLVTPHFAGAQGWPSKPVRVVVPQPPGGPADIMGRMLAQRLSAKFGQPFVIENRSGANGNIGTEYVAKSPPDGYTLVSDTSGPLTSNRYLYKSMGYDPVKDLTPIVLISEVPLIALVNQKVPAKNLAQLAELARAQPGKLNAGSSTGNGSMSHLTLELFKSIAKADLVHVPFKSPAQAFPELLSGNIQVIFDPITTSIKHLQAGTVRGLAVTTRVRFPAVPDVPTAIEQGFNIEASFWSALLGPAGLPRPIVDKLNQAANEYLKMSETPAKLVAIGMQPIGGSPERLSALIASDSEKWKRVIEAAGIRMD